MEILFLILAPALFVHTLHAASLTYAQRVGLLAAISDKDPVAAIAKLDVFRAVPFDRHFWRVVTLRNPWKIYPRELLDEVQWVA